MSTTMDTDLQPTQPTQQDGVPTNPLPPEGTFYWATLKPLFPHYLSNIVLYNLNQSYVFGRNPNSSIVLPGPKISNKHCVITKEAPDADASLKDFSTNGTFVNGRRIGKGITCILRDGMEVAFGSLTPQENPAENYRFMYCEKQDHPTGINVDYDLGSVLGHGTFATVIRAIHRSTGVAYAVKKIHNFRKPPASFASGNASTEPLEAVRREIQILQGLKHENICRLHEVFLDDNKGAGISLVLEFVDGGDLLSYILDQEGLAEGQSQDIIYQICSALAYCHDRGIAHRDLKPENVLLTRDRPPIVKVADFGLAKVADSMTMLKTMCGTPNYLAPEVVWDDVDTVGYSHLVDSWSIGIITFSMLSNAVAFADDDIADLREKVRTRKVQWEYLEHFNLTANCKSFVHELLQNDPKERMSMVRALEHPWLQNHVPFYRFDQPAWEWRSNRAEIAEPKAYLEKHGIVVAQAPPPQIQVQPSVDVSLGNLNLRAQPSTAQAGAGSQESDVDSIFPPSQESQETTPMLCTPAQSLAGIPEVPPAPKKGGKLRRRRDILDEAEEQNIQMYSPPMHMVERWEQVRGGNAEPGPSNLSAEEPVVEDKGTKRGHDEIDSDVVMADKVDAEDVVDAMVISPRKRGKTSAAPATRAATAQKKKVAEPPKGTRKSNRIAKAR